MGNFLNFLELLSITLWMGSLTFLLLVVAPTLGPASRPVFPKYYLLAAACGIVLTGVQISRGVLWYWGGMIKPSIVLFSLLTVIQIHARTRRSAIVNGFTMVFLLLYLVWMSLRGY